MISVCVLDDHTLQCVRMYRDGQLGPQPSLSLSWGAPVPGLGGSNSQEMSSPRAGLSCWMEATQRQGWSWLPGGPRAHPGPGTQGHLLTDSHWPGNGESALVWGLLRVSTLTTCAALLRGWGPPSSPGADPEPTCPAGLPS